MSVIRGVRGLITTFDLSVMMTTVAVAVSVPVVPVSIGWAGVRFNTITRVIGVLAFNWSIDWNISSSSLILSSVKDLFFVSVLSLVGDLWDLPVLSGGDWSVGSLVDSIVSGFSLCFVLSFMLNSIVSVEDCVISSLFILSVEDLILVRVSGLWLVSVLGDGVRSLEDADVSSVSVFFLLSVENVVVSFVGGVWDISVVGLSVISVLLSWLESVSGVVIWSVLDLVLSGVPHFFFGSVLDFSLLVCGGDWDLSSPDFSLGLGCDGVLNFFVDDFDITELGLLTILGVSVLVLIVVSVLDANGLSNCKDECCSETLH